MQTIALCSSVTSYKKVVEIKNHLQESGFAVLVPKLAGEMEKANDYELLSYQEEYQGPTPQRKGELIRAGFENISKSDAVLIVNEKKHDQQGYIGPNVLMEMAIGFYLQKPIYLLYPYVEIGTFKDEIFGMQPIVLNNDLSKLAS